MPVRNARPNPTPATTAISLAESIRARGGLFHRTVPLGGEAAEVIVVPLADHHGALFGEPPVTLLPSARVGLDGAPLTFRNTFLVAATRASPRR